MSKAQVNSDPVFPHGTVGVNSGQIVQIDNHCRVAMPGHYTKMQMQTERSIPLHQSTTTGTGFTIVQASQLASAMNNRLYRQTRNYNVGFRLAEGVARTATSPKVLDFYTLPNTWFVHGAIKDAYDTYMQTMADEMAAGIKPAKWHDFHINEQNMDGTWDFTKAMAYDGDAWAEISVDESITDSSVTGRDGTSEGFHLFGAVSNSFNIFSEFAKKLNYQVSDDPTVSSDQPYDGLLDLDDADVLAERGDRPPYDQDFSSWLHDGTDDQNVLVWRDSIYVDSDGGATKMATRKFDAPLGLVLVKYESGGSAANYNATPLLTCELTSGTYKGVKAPSLV